MCFWSRSHYSLDFSNCRKFHLCKEFWKRTNKFTFNTQDNADIVRHHMKIQGKNVSEITPTSHYSSCSLPTPSMNLPFVYFFPTSKCETGITLAHQCTSSQKCSLFLVSSAPTLQPVMWPWLRVGATVGLLEELIHILSPSALQWSSWQPALLISEVSSLSRWRREERAPQTTTTSASTRYVEAGARSRRPELSGKVCKRWTHLHAVMQTVDDLAVSRCLRIWRLKVLMRVTAKLWMSGPSCCGGGEQGIRNGSSREMQTRHPWR